MKVLYVFIAVGLLCVSPSCTEQKKKLPYLGERQLAERVVDGKVVVDTIYHQIPSFRLINQEGQVITEKDFEGKVYVADFFFTTCPTICPKMSAEMLRVYEHYREEPLVALLSHSIDTRHDSVPVLKAYAEKLGVEAPKWHFVTGKRRDIYELARQYMVTADEDPSAPGGYIHSGALLLVDTQRHIRGTYNGVDPKDTERLIADIAILLEELKASQP